LQTEELADSKFNIAMHLSASKLDKKDFFGKVSVYDITHCCTVHERSSIMIMGRAVMVHIVYIVSPKWKFKEQDVWSGIILVTPNKVVYYMCHLPLLSFISLTV
jgi:hypothetical protein